MEKEKWYMDVLKRSMIPGFKAMSQSKKCSMLSFRMCVLLCAITGFVWQTKVLVEEYLRYPTILNIKNRQVALLHMPGVTFCYLNGLQGKVYCEGTLCKQLTAKEFKELYPGEKLPNHPADFWVPLNLSRLYMLPPKMLLQLVDSRYQPTVAPYLNYFQMYMDNVEMKRAPFVRSHARVPPMCYYFNVLEKHENYSVRIQKTRFLAATELRLKNMHFVSDGLRLDAQLNMGQISVHSRNNFNNPFTSGVSVEKGKHIILRVKQVLKKSLPYPYETDCHDYVTEIEERNSPGPTNLMECIEQCKLTVSLMNLNCVLESIWYPHNYQRCMPDNQLQLLEEYHQKCAPQCREACWEMTYEVQKEEEYILPAINIGKEWDNPLATELLLKKKWSTDISIVFDSERYFLYERQPKYNMVEIMSHIGSFLGMWMGVSMIAILNLFEILLTTFFYCIKKRKSNTKPIVINIA